MHDCEIFLECEEIGDIMFTAREMQDLMQRWFGEHLMHNYTITSEIFSS